MRTTGHNRAFCSGAAPSPSFIERLEHHPVSLCRGAALLRLISALSGHLSDGFPCPSSLHTRELVNGQAHRLARFNNFFSYLKLTTEN
jgi:hypothetical protein